MNIFLENRNPSIQKKYKGLPQKQKWIASRNMPKFSTIEPVVFFGMGGGGCRVPASFT